MMKDHLSYKTTFCGDMSGHQSQLSLYNHGITINVYTKIMSSEFIKMKSMTKTPSVISHMTDKYPE